MDLVFAGHRLRLHERELIGPEGSVQLSARSFDILRTFLERPNELIDKSALFDAVWPRRVVEDNTLQVHISSLRKLLGPGYISTVHGRGYKYVGPIPISVTARSEQSAPQAPSGNIVQYVSECVARETEIADVLSLIERHRVTSILGAGGVGKTTLAIEVAARHSSRRGSAAWVIDLAPVADIELIPSAIIQALAIPFRASASTLDTVFEHLRNEELLLVLDNCEHVLSAVTGIAKALLPAATRVKMILTSQAQLGLPEEHVYKLAPFGIPDPTRPLEESQSFQFFTHCYEASGERIAESEQIVVARLCERLDGLALALKMAASRAATMGLETVDRQIAREVDSLAASWDTPLPRHQSLIASLSWSYNLLTDDEQRTFRALGVFNGSLSFQAAVAVARTDTGECLSELLRRSLVVRDTNAKSRYRLLETSRHFALDQLLRRREEGDVRRRHASYLKDLFEDSLDNWERLTDQEWLSAYGRDTDNLRSALEWSSAQSRPHEYAELAAASYRLWLEAGLPREGTSQCERALRSTANSLDPGLDARLRLASAELFRANSLDRRVLEVIDPAVQHFREHKDIPRLIQSLLLKGFGFITRGCRDEARRCYGECDQMIHVIATSKLKARALVAIGINHLVEDDDTLGLAKCEAGLAMHRATGNTRGRFRSALFLAEALHWRGDNERAIEVGAGALRELRDAGYKLELGAQLSNVAAYYLATGAVNQAREILLEAVEYVPRDDACWHWFFLQNAAEFEILAGDRRRAAQLMGFLDRRYDGSDPRQITDDLQRDRIFKRLRSEFSEDDLQRLTKEGEEWGIFEADYFAGFPITEAG
jgi:predicted ATPase/DNA-binding winged helix-turn-helix (wHTH) protein